VTVIYPERFAHTLHVASREDEWTSLCGSTNDPQHHVMQIVEKRELKKKLRPGYKWCADCVTKAKFKVSRG
jgi:hypothetical protein